VFVDHDQFQFTPQLTGALVSVLLGLDGTSSTSMRHGCCVIFDFASWKPGTFSLLIIVPLESALQLQVILGDINTKKKGMLMVDRRSKE
jgi:hypothetical protein